VALVWLKFYDTLRAAKREMFSFGEIVELAKKFKMSEEDVVAFLTLAKEVIEKTFYISFYPIYSFNIF
jgi:hypothetical protein